MVTLDDSSNVVRGAICASYGIIPLFDDERCEVFGAEELLSHLLHLLGGYGVDAVEELLDVLLPAVVEEAFAEIDGKLLAVVGGNTQLSFQLAFGGLQLSGRQRALHQSVEFAANQPLTMLDVVVVATEIDAPSTRVGIEGG